MNEMVSGVRADVAVKLFGDDLDVLAAKGEEIEAILNQIPGSADVSVEQMTGQPVLQIKLNQEQLARYGVPAKVGPRHRRIDRQQAAGRSDRRAVALPARRSAAGDNAGRRRGDRLDPGADRRGRAICRCRGWPTSSVVEGPSTITREWGQRRITVSANVRGRDMGSFVAEAQKQMKEQLQAAARAGTSTSGAASSSTCSGRDRAPADRRARAAGAHLHSAVI